MSRRHQREARRQRERERDEPCLTINYLQYEEHDEGTIVRIMLNRPETRNAQNRGLLVELDDAFRRPRATTRCGSSSSAASGPMFSSGHDMGSAEAMAEDRGSLAPDQRPINGGTRQGAEQRMLQEWHYFFENTLRWRNLRKITIAQVHGTVYAAGLMLMWACDLIVAADERRLRRRGRHPARHVRGRVLRPPLGVRPPQDQGAHAHRRLDRRRGGPPPRHGVQDLPARRAREQTLEFARRIAKLPTMTALLIKESVNQTVDNMGFYNALQACFTLHQLNHAHWAEVHEDKMAVALPEDGVADWRTPPVLVSVPGAVEGPPTWAPQADPSAPATG